MIAKLSLPTATKGVGGIRKESEVGDGLLSHAVARILPSALVGLTSGFEMEPGVPPPLLPPTIPFSYSTSNLLLAIHCRL